MNLAKQNLAWLAGLGLAATAAVAAIVGLGSTYNEHALAFEPIGPTWPLESIPVAYCVNTANPPTLDNGLPPLTDDEFVAIVRQAFQAWEDIPGSFIAFRYDGTCHNDPQSPSGPRFSKSTRPSARRITTA